MLPNAVSTAPLSFVAAAIGTFRRRGCDQRPGAVLSVGVFYAMDAGRANTAAWLHARLDIRPRNG